MRIYKIHGKKNTPGCIFAILKDERIWMESPVMGCCFREDLTTKKLSRHINQMKAEGFTVEEVTL